MFKDTIKRALSQYPSLGTLCHRIISLYPFSYRQGKAFRDFYVLLNTTQNMSTEKLQSLQFQKLKELLHFAYTYSPFYKELYDSHGVNLKNIQTFDDFKKSIPLVTKDILQKANSLNIPYKKQSILSTSGTTGSPFQFPINPSGQAMEMAAIYHQWIRAGFGPEDRRVELRGVQVQPIAVLPHLNVVRFSIINMEDSLKQMVDYLNKSHIGFIHGYPSAIAKFAFLLRENNLSLQYPLQGVFLASENVYSWQTEIIREVLNPKQIIAHYGNAERIALGAWCEKKEAYHFIPLYGYVERGPRGELIGTSFINRCTPFIRYQTSDILLDWSERPCSDCSRGYVPLVKEIGGRLEDYLLDDKNEQIPPAVATFPFKSLRAIQTVQIIQHKDKNLTLQCTLSHDRQYLKNDQKTISDGLHQVLGRSIEIEFDFVDQIPLTDACKFKWIISHAQKRNSFIRPDNINSQIDTKIDR
jgi:phenylacetate-CoA ligase